MVTITQIKNAVKGNRKSSSVISLADKEDAVLTQIGNLIESIVASNGEERRHDLNNLATNRKLFRMVVTYCNANKPSGVEEINGKNLASFYKQVVKEKIAELPEPESGV